MKSSKVLHACFVFLALSIITLLSIAMFAPPVYNEVTPERKATHMIQFVAPKDDGRIATVAYCTATAVGPAALLIAEHCTEGTGTFIKIDMSQQIYVVTGGVKDGRDHAIIRVEDANFKNTVTIKERAPVLGESVHMYGVGGGDYPAHAEHGKVIKDQYAGDLSDIDQAIGAACYSLPVIEGDSGSVVYAEDGSMVGMITMARSLDGKTYSYSTGFSLNFSPTVIKVISEMD